MGKSGRETAGTPCHGGGNKAAFRPNLDDPSLAPRLGQRICRMANIYGIPREIRSPIGTRLPSGFGDRRRLVRTRLASAGGRNSPGLAMLVSPRPTSVPVKPGLMARCSIPAKLGVGDRLGVLPRAAPSTTSLPFRMQASSATSSAVRRSGSFRRQTLRRSPLRRPARGRTLCSDRIGQAVM